MSAGEGHLGIGEGVVEEQELSEQSAEEESDK